MPWACLAPLRWGPSFAPEPGWSPGGRYGATPPPLRLVETDLEAGWYQKGGSITGLSRLAVNLRIINDNLAGYFRGSMGCSPQSCEDVPIMHILVPNQPRFNLPSPSFRSAESYLCFNPSQQGKLKNMKTITHLHSRRNPLTTTIPFLQGSIYLRFAVLMGALLMIMSVARADGLLWDWTYNTDESFTSGLFFTGVGTFTTTSTAIGGYYAVTGITGTWTISPGDNPGPTYTITSLISPGSDGGVGGTTGENDNLLAIASPQLTTYAGIAFTDSSGETDTILGDPSYIYRGAIVVSGTPSYDNGGFFTATQVAAVPEPSNLAAGLLCMALIAYRSAAQCRLKR